MTLLLMSLLAALLSVILRLRHARGNDREQLKWFLFAAVPLTVLGSANGVDKIVGNLTTDFMFHPVYLLYSSGLLVPVLYLEVLALLLVPVCTYVAILRYNLYDIGVLINRTLVYGALTTCVVAIYVLAVRSWGSSFRLRATSPSHLLPQDSWPWCSSLLGEGSSVASTASCTAKGRSVRGDLAPR